MSFACVKISNELRLRLLIQLLKVTRTFFSKNRGKFTVAINKRTLLCTEVTKEFSLFLKVHDKFVIVRQRWNTRIPPL